MKTTVQNCKDCQLLLPSKPIEPHQHSFGSYPLEQTSSDLFQEAGKNYLVYADRYSGMLWCDRLNQTQTRNVTGLLKKWMLDFGYPRSMRTDGGPQYRTEFQQWCTEHGIEHSLSSPYNPQSNGHAEGAVKQAKYLLKKCGGNMEAFRSALFEWRNTPRADGISPCLLYTSPSPRDKRQYRMPSSA